ncbi:MAG: Fur family ferric uptake transcriptional regulator [Bradymonadia bacterium]|jgi:Fur family ferric uptake transcriptional regulator
MNPATDNVVEEMDVDAILKRFHKRLSELGLKSTRQRDSIVETFFKLNRHISVEEMLEEVRKTAPKTGYATVYRTMKLLVDHGFAEPRKFGDGQTRFDPKESEDEHHDHIICVDCRRVIEFTDAVVGARVEQILSEQGDFALSRQVLELYATCSKTDCEFRTRD